MTLLDIVILSIASFIWGCLQKYSDLVSEHGLKEKFSGAGYFSAITWSLLGVLISIKFPFAGITYFGVVLYWILKRKLEYFNLSLMGTLFLLGQVISIGHIFHKHWNYLILFFALNTILSLLCTYLRDKRNMQGIFFKCRVWIYIPPIVISVLAFNLEPVVVVVFNMLGIEILKAKYQIYQTQGDQQKRFIKNLDSKYKKI